MQKWSLFTGGIAIFQKELSLKTLALCVCVLWANRANHSALTLNRPFHLRHTSIKHFWKEIEGFSKSLLYQMPHKSQNTTYEFGGKCKTASNAYNGGHSREDICVCSGHAPSFRGLLDLRWIFVTQCEPLCTCRDRVLQPGSLHVKQSWQIRPNGPFLECLFGHSDAKTRMDARRLQLS